MLDSDSAMRDFNIFTLLKHLPERIVTSTGDAPDRAVTEGAEHIKIAENGVTIDPEFWVGRFNRKVINGRKVN